MPSLKNLNGDDLVKFFMQHGFVLRGQKGSHLKLRRVIEGRKQTLVIPNHSPIRVGTLRSIFTQALMFVPDDTLRKFFYDN